MADQNGFTPTQRKILAILADGKPHDKKELHGCLFDELGAVTNVSQHISNLRKILNPRGEDIVCVTGVIGRKPFYRHVRLLASPYNGKR